MNKIVKIILNTPAFVVVGVINLYQKTLSPDHGLFKARFPYGYCRHFPSCSEYSKQAITKYGLLKGGWMATGRVLRCNPFSKPSVDTINNI